MNVVESSSRDVFANLALEEALLDQVAVAGGLVLAFYINDSAVVVGRNQNPWRETNLRFLREKGIALARRVSGGGTVYHDAGNLNYSLIMSRDRYHRDEVFERIIAALARVGVPAERSGTHGLSTGGRKFSGSAFCYRKGAVLHHGTLLVRADLDRLHGALAAPECGMRTKAVPSVPASVVNLADVNPSLDFASLKMTLCAAFEAWNEESSRPAAGVDPDAKAIQSLASRNRDWDWIYAESPEFSLEIPALDGAKALISVSAGRLSHIDPTIPAAAAMLGTVWRTDAIRDASAGLTRQEREWWTALTERLL